MGKNQKFQKFLEKLPGECWNEAACQNLKQSAQWLWRYDAPNITFKQKLYIFCENSKNGSKQKIAKIP